MVTAAYGRRNRTGASAGEMAAAATAEFVRFRPGRPYATESRASGPEQRASPPHSAPRPSSTDRRAWNLAN